MALALGAVLNKYCKIKKENCDSKVRLELENSCSVSQFSHRSSALNKSNILESNFPWQNPFLSIVHNLFEYLSKRVIYYLRSCLRWNTCGIKFARSDMLAYTLLVIVVTFDSPSCLVQGTAKGPFDLQVKLPPVYHTRRRLHTVPLIAERQAGKLWILFFDLTRLGIKPGSTVSVADALSTRPLIGRMVTASDLEYKSWNFCVI